MSRIFEPKSKEEFLKGIDRGLAQAKSGQRMDAKEAVRDMSMALKAGYHAMNEVHTANNRRAAVNS